MDDHPKLNYAAPPPPGPRGWTFLLIAIGVCVGMLAIGTAMWGLRLTTNGVRSAPGSAGTATTAVSK